MRGQGRADAPREKASRTEATVPEGQRPPTDRANIDAVPEERGGEAACWAHLVCPDCGSIESEGHRPSCPQAGNS
jgi:hypothetical protein